MEQHVHDLAEGLTLAGHEVHLLTTPLPPEGPLTPLPPVASVTHVGARPAAYDLAFFRQALPEALRLQREHALDIVHTQGLALYAFSRQRAFPAPIVGTIHGTHWNETPLDARHPERRRLVRTVANLWHYKHRLATWPLWRAMLARRPNLIVDSDFTRRELLRESPLLVPRVVPLGFDTTPFVFLTRDEARALRQRLLPTVKPEGPLLFAVGRHERVKGFATVLAALRSIPSGAPFTFVIGGSGPDTHRIKDLARQSPHAARIQFIGRVHAELLPSWFACADLFLNADQGQPAFGLVNAEALVCGTRVLASEVGAHPEVILEGDGTLLPADNRRAWQSALLETVRSLPEDDATRLGRRERALARFCREAMIEGIEEAYRAVLNRAASRASRSTTRVRKP
jgi:glycosyltransferase involved in cell wall biosynthesis